MEQDFEIIDFLADEVSSDTAVNVMGQYRPCYKADSYPLVNRCPGVEEIKKVRLYAKKRGLRLVQ